SIIMPCYNVGSTLARALDSILMQETDFQYEVLVVNDASTDDTVEVASQYMKKHPQIKLMENEKNSGNARTFYNGLCAAKGKYFCVLDGDDFYSVPNKLQKQVDFFNSDVKEEYVAVVHHFVTDLCDGTISMVPRYPKREFNFTDHITGKAGYFHTSTYMYRNIFQGNVLEFYKDELFRGDGPRTLFHLMYSRKKVRVLDFVGSVYCFNYNGIWTGMDEKKQFALRLKVNKGVQNILQSSFEKEAIGKTISYLEEKVESSEDELRKFENVPYDYVLDKIKQYSKRFAFSQREYTFQGFYHSEYLDSACATISYMFDCYHPELVQDTVDEGTVVMIVGRLNPHGGGVFEEITEFSRIFSDKNFVILVTEMSELTEEMEYEVEKRGLKVICYTDKSKGRLAFFKEQMKKLAPCKAYCYAAHNDATAQAVLSKGVCKNINLFSFDHGCVLGIANPNYDVIIAKRPVDYALLHREYGEKVIYIPTPGMQLRPNYEPFKDHQKLITACAAARFYKVDGSAQYNYFDYVIALLKNAKGRHFHFGPIEPEKMDEIRQRMEEEGVPEDSFVCIEWAEDLGAAFLENHVDVFIEPFPTLSYKITLEAMAVGLPVAALNGYRKIDYLDFAYADHICFNNKEEFVERLSNLTKEDLSRQSRLAVDYYKNTHHIDAVRDCYRNDRAFGVPPEVWFTDNVISDVTDFPQLFGDKLLRINICATDLLKERMLKKKNALEVKRLKREIQRIYNSQSYRAGYKFLHPVKARSENIPSKKIKTNDIAELREELRKVKKSRRFKIGRMITASARRKRGAMRKQNEET
ncbi:MAG: glycosyltransferase, partial [Eubacterium sp.]|nr:glycosyltransferase [Eubacterium sp.]